MKITVVDLQGKRIALNIEKTHTILDIKKKIQYSYPFPEGIPPENQKLFLQNRILEDYETVESSKMNSDSYIRVIHVVC